MLTKDQILAELGVFKLTTGGLGNWLTEDTDSEVFLRLGMLDKTPISKVQLNQLLAFGHEAPVSEDFFRYYWLSVPLEHPYDVKAIPNFEARWLDSSSIVSLAHLKWGLYRIFVDGLLWFGNVRTAYRELRALDAEKLDRFYRSRRFDTNLIKGRGPALPLQTIAKDELYSSHRP